MSSTPSHAIVLDPFSSGRFLVDEFHRRGVPCVAVLTRGVPAVFASGFDASVYAAVIHAQHGLDQLITDLTPYKPRCVLTGVETGIALMDSLAAHFGLPGNDPRSSAMRRDKFLMQEAIRAHNLPAVAQCCVDSTRQAADWLETQRHYPVVVKPAASAGSDNIHICSNAEAALDGVARVLDADNLFGGKNEQALVQAFLDGQEWVVDTVSCAGKTVVTNVTKYKKIANAQGKVVYRHSAFLTPDATEHGALLDYALRVVDALGIRYGAAHTEIIETANGHRLVEVNARMHGGDAVSVLREFAPFTQLELTVDSHLDPEAFARKANTGMAYRSHVMAHFLISRVAGKVNKVIERQRLAAIASYAGDHLPDLGGRLVVTDSLTSAPGYIWLANESQAHLQHDQDTLIAWEEAGLLYS